MRVATRDAYGEVLNQYTGHRRVDAAAPDRPWAVYLAGTDQHYRLLCFDLDAKGEDGSAAARDAEMIAGLLDSVGLAVVVCESGPSGGRHVWTALIESVDPESVATLARLARGRCPTLDIAPLTNPATGCVRPPGAPHRSGGRSVVLRGDLHTLIHPTGTAAQVHQLIEVLAQHVTDTEPAHDLDPHRPLPLDDHGRLYLPGHRRPLPAVSAAALREHAAAGDASAVLWRILIGAAAAKWRHADIAALVDTAPGLEHVRTYRDRSHRTPRTPSDAARLLRRQWDKAVRHVASSPRQIGADPTFDARAAAITTHVRHVQSRADAAAGRWTHGGGPADRRVLDVLCILALQALQVDIEADIRRLALLAGIGRETARTALIRLAADGWITHTQAATGPHGAHWTIDPTGAFHTPVDTDRSQADPRPPLPPGAGAAERTILLETLTARAEDANHDLFTAGPGGLGHHAGNLYARISETPRNLVELSQITGTDRATTRHTLDRLTSTGVLIHTRDGWHRRTPDPRTAAAAHLGVSGRLNDRARQYRIERELWAWWQAEHAWMQAPRRPATTHRPGRGQLALLPNDGTHAYGPHPRRPDGRLDWHEARRIITA